MDETLKSAIEKIKIAKNKLDSFPSREEAIEYMMKKAKIEKKSCDIAYDFLHHWNTKMEEVEKK